MTEILINAHETAMVIFALTVLVISWTRAERQPYWVVFSVMTGFFLSGTITIVGVLARIWM